jgi:DNA-binding CsgD family transcriptional regulator
MKQPSGHYLPRDQIPRTTAAVTRGKFAALQHTYKEFPQDPLMMQVIRESGQHAAAVGYSDELIELRERLQLRVVSNLQTILTERQHTALTLYTSGLYTQTEIAEQMGICQSSVHKTIFGNIVYKVKPIVRHGGAISRLRKWAETDAECIEILQAIADLADED